MSDWHKEETYKSLIQIGTSALRFVILANGGAAIAILALLGELYSNKAVLPPLSFSLGYFLAGIFFGGVAHITGYITQLILYNEAPGTLLPWFKGHRFWLNASLLLVTAGIICFGLGAWSGVSSLLCIAEAGGA